MSFSQVALVKMMPCEQEIVGSNPGQTYCFKFPFMEEEWPGNCDSWV